MLDIHSTTASPEHNVQGWERVTSLAGGALMISKGMRHGGIIGLLQVTLGGLAVARGVKGQCATKAWLQKHRAEYQSLRSEIEDSAEQLRTLKNNAVEAVKTATVTGKDPLTGI